MPSSGVGHVMRTVMRNRTWVLALLAAVAVSAGCVSIDRREAPSAVTCHTQYRPDAESMTGATEPSLTVMRADDTAPRPQTHEFDTLTLEVAYQGDAPEGRNVTVTVSTSDGRPLVRDLYQLGDGSELDLEFAGGHGFTGLQYVFHEEASLQVWCTADDA